MAINIRLASAVCAWAVGISSAACALPVLDAKDAAVRITTPDAATMNIASTARNNVIRWVDFSVAGGEKPETVRFDGNDYLNYVTGHAQSEILGTLTGSGNIFIVNPHGILIGDGAKVSVGNLYLSTRVLSDGQLAEFSAHGTSPFQYAGDAIGDVVNLGTLNATSITVEGDVIKFKNVEQLETETINVSAKTETRVGYDAERVNPSAYASLYTAQWYELVKNEIDLQNMQLNKNYMLAGDMKVIDNFQPIGGIGGIDGRYTGRFDGLGYTVELKKVTPVSNKIGLFGAIGSGSVVENVGVITEEMTFPEKALEDIYVGGVVGYNAHGKIQNVWHEGNISIDKSCGVQYVGGIVGCNDGGTITSVYNTGDILTSRATTYAYVGGIVGNQMGSGLTESVYNKGNVQADCTAWAGGVAGVNLGGHIQDVYNIGSVSAPAAGGIVGRSDRKETYGGDVSYAYHACGSITGAHKGAIVGAESNGSFEHVFFANKDAAGKKLSDTKAVGSGRDTLQTAQMFMDDGWDISAKGGSGKTWRIYDGNSTPLLAALLKPKDNIGIVEEDGSKAPGAYWDTPSGMFSTQLTAYQKGDQTFYKKGYDYVSDVICVLSKQEATETPTKPSAPTRPSNPMKPSNPTNPSGTMKPSDTVKPSEAVKTFDGETMATRYPLSREYENELAALYHLERDEKREASEESGTEKLVIEGTGVRLPDDIISVEEAAAMLSNTETRENQEKQ